MVQLASKKKMPGFGAMKTSKKTPLSSVKSLRSVLATLADLAIGHLQG